MDTPFRGRNRWPNEELLPGFRPAMTAYYHAMNGVAERCLLQLRHQRGQWTSSWCLTCCVMLHSVLLCVICPQFMTASWYACKFMM